MGSSKPMVYRLSTDSCVCRQTVSDDRSSANWNIYQLPVDMTINLGFTTPIATNQPTG